MGEKIKNMFRGHKEKKKNQNGGFSYMLASFIIHKRGWIESVFVRAVRPGPRLRTPVLRSKPSKRRPKAPMS